MILFAFEKMIPNSKVFQCYHAASERKVTFADPVQRKLCFDLQYPRKKKVMLNLYFIDLKVKLVSEINK